MSQRMRRQLERGAHALRKIALRSTGAKGARARSALDLLQKVASMNDAQLAAMDAVATAYLQGKGFSTDGGEQDIAEMDALIEQLEREGKL